MTRVLIRNAGHEVRTPLNSIINYLEVALEEVLDERARHHLRISLEASKSLVFVVNDLLRLTEAESGGPSAHEDNVDLRSMLSEIIAAFKGELEKRSINVRPQDEAAVPRIIRCDPNGLRQVLSNLLANATNCSEGGCISVSLRRIEVAQDTFSIQISVEDEGQGLSEQQLDAIFQDFEQILEDDDESGTTPTTVSGVTNEPKFGIGLGLATAARFARINHGQISMSSEGLGKGTRVTLTIPLRTPAEFDLGKRRRLSSQLVTPPEESPLFQRTDSMGDRMALDVEDIEGDRRHSKAGSTPSSSTSRLPLSKEDVTSQSNSMSSQNQYPFPTLAPQDDRSTFNILVAEDNPLNSRLLETRLKKRGHTVHVAVDGKACLDAFQAAPGSFDIILMDIQVTLITPARSPQVFLFVTFSGESKN